MPHTGKLLREAPPVVLVALGASAEAGGKTKKTLDDIHAYSSEVREKISGQQKTVDALVEQIRISSGKAALQKYAQFFDEKAKSAKNSAGKWLWATAIAGALMLGCLLVLVFQSPADERTTTQFVQTAGAKVALFSIAFYGLSWCGRNYKALWHIHVVNKHRANTLNAMEAFANSASKNDVREAVLIHASSAIFAQVSTGFIPDQSDAPAAPTILEIIRSGKDT